MKHSSFGKQQYDMYLLDTCTFIWYIETSSRLPEDIRELIDDGDNDIFISKATFWEIAIKQTIGKLDDITMSIIELAGHCADNRITILPLKFEYIEKTKQLPLIHRDPFDRIIMATAIEEKYTLITRDSNIMKYDGLKCLWETS